jgi:hypothetical protein
MRKIHTTVFAGIVALAAAGAAVAASKDTHVMKLDLPDGSVAQIEYNGDVAPKVTVAPAPKTVAARLLDPLTAAPFGLFDQMTADMDLQANMMLQRVGSLPLKPEVQDGKIDVAALQALPAGSMSYSFVSTGSGTGTCSRSVQVTSFGPGRQPKVVSNTSGACGAIPAAASTALSAQKTPAETAPAKPTASGDAAKILHTT